MSRRKLPPIDPIREAIVDNLTKPEPKAQLSEPKGTDISIDSLLQDGLKSIHMLMRVIRDDIRSGAPERNTVMNLKDAMAMLHELKEKEQDLLDKLSDEDLAKIAGE